MTDNVVVTRFDKKIEGYILVDGNKVPVYREQNQRPYILRSVPDDLTGERAVVKQYVDVGVPQHVGNQFENPIYGGDYDAKAVYQPN